MTDLQRLAESIYETLMMDDCLLPSNESRALHVEKIESLLSEAMREHGQMVLRNSVAGEPASYIAQGKHEAYTRAAEVARTMKSCGAMFPNCDCNTEIAAAIKGLREDK